MNAPMLSSRQRSPELFFPLASRGFTLVELLVSMGLGLLVLLALTGIFATNSQTRSEIERTNRQIENGRYALQLLADDLANAGFWGEGTMGGALVMQNICAEADDPPGASASNENNLVQAANSGVLMPLVGASSDSALGCTPNIRPNTEVLAVRRASSCAAGQNGCDAFESGVPHLQVMACTSQVATLQAAGSLTGQIGAGVPRVATGEGNLRFMTRACNATEFMPRYRLLSHVYYVANDNRAGDGTPTLVRAELGAEAYSAIPLVEGIEQLRFEYGIDTNGNGEPNTFLTLAGMNAAQFANVVAVRIFLLARNTEKTPGYTDEKTYEMGLAGEITLTTEDKAYRRQLYSTTVRLNNVAGRREGGGP
jgi:type IV pilus assembly protein PilW